MHTTHHETYRALVKEVAASDSSTFAIEPCEAAAETAGKTLADFVRDVHAAEQGDQGDQDNEPSQRDMADYNTLLEATYHNLQIGNDDLPFTETTVASVLANAGKSFDDYQADVLELVSIDAEMERDRLRFERSMQELREVFQ